MTGYPSYVFAFGLERAVFLVSSLLGVLYLAFDIMHRNTKMTGNDFLDYIPLVLVIVQGIGAAWYLDNRNDGMVIMVIFVCTGGCIVWELWRRKVHRRKEK